MNRRLRCLEGELLGRYTPTPDHANDILDLRAVFEKRVSGGR